MKERINYNFNAGDYVLNSRHELGLIKEIQDDLALLVLGDDVTETIPLSSLTKVEASSFNIIPKSNSPEVQDNAARQKVAVFLSDVRVSSGDYYLLEDSLTKLLNGDDARLDLRPYSIGLYDKVVSVIEGLESEPDEELYNDVFERCFDMDDEPSDFDIKDIYDELLKQKMIQISVEWYGEDPLKIDDLEF